MINKCRKLDQKYDFYLFADQDDVWDPDKLEKMIAFYDRQCEVLKFDDSCPVFIQGNMRVIDKDGKVIIPDLDAEDHIRRDGVSIYFDAATWGCNTMMNRSMFMDIKPIPDDAKRVWGHDQYFARWACIRGRFLYDPEIVFSYRRYSQSVTGDHDLQVTKKRVMSRLAKVNELAFDHAISYKSALFVLDQLEKADLTKDQQAQVTQLRTVIERGGLRAFLYWKKQGIDLGRRVRSLSHLGILTLGMHRKHLGKIE